MKIIVSDDYILFDLFKFNLINGLFNIGYDIHIPIFIYQELKQGVDKNLLQEKGIVVDQFEGDELQQIQAIRQIRTAISFPDASGIYLAQKEDAILLTADLAMYNTAIEVNVTTYRTLWLVKQIYLNDFRQKDKIIEALNNMKLDHSCRIPDDLIDDLCKEILDIDAKRV